jgi:hypothetical protein
VISDERKKFLQVLVENRYAKILVPAHKRACKILDLQKNKNDLFVDQTKQQGVSSLGSRLNKAERSSKRQGSSLKLPNKGKEQNSR